MVKNSFVFILLLISMLASHPLFATDISVRSDRNPVAMNQSFLLIYEADSGPDDDPDFSPLESELDILNRSQSSNISIINGEYSSKQTWTLTVMARHSGELKLPPIAFGDDTSPGLTISVAEAAQTPGEMDEFFLRMRVDRRQAYVQQQVVLTRQLYTAYNLGGYAFGDLSFKGVEAVSKPLGDEKQYRTRIGDREFRVIEQQFAVFPQQAGQLQVAPLLAKGQTAARSGMFDPFGSRGRIVQTRSDPIAIEVQPVPADAAMNPWLPARNLEITEQWSTNPPRFTQGEPLTRTLSIKAEGLTAVQLPEIPQTTIDAVKQYPDQPLLKDIRNPSGISGHRVEKIAYIATGTGRVELPALEIPWWDTVNNRRRVAYLEPRVIEIDAVQHSQPAAPTTSMPRAIQEVSPMAQPEPVAAAPGPVEVSPPGGYWLAALAFLGWLATAVAWWLNARGKKVVSANTDVNAADSGKAMKDLLSACKTRDGVAVRRALLVWARAYFRDDSIHAISQLRWRLPPPLPALLGQLDESLYAEGGQPVDFEQMAEGLRRFLRDDRQDLRPRSVSTLHPLYK